jgi:preprotein translocase subunit SecA
MNIQREAIYQKRRNALSGERLSVDLNHMFEGLIENLVASHQTSEDFEGFRRATMQSLGIDPEFDSDYFNRTNSVEIAENLQSQFVTFYREKGEKMSAALYPIVKNVYENEGHRYKYIALPITDGSKKQLQISADLKDAVESQGVSILSDIEKAVSLSLIDDNWKEHLRSMDELKDSVQAASFEQKDPLVVYKMEAYELFEQVIYRINYDVTSFLSKGKLLINEPDEVREARSQKTDLSKIRVNRGGGAGGGDNGNAARQAAEAVSERPKQETIRRQDPKVGRNDACPCGSGKKYKHCHGRN